MAILIVSKELIQNSESFEKLKNLFDTFEEIKGEEKIDCKVYRVINNDIPVDDVKLHLTIAEPKDGPLRVDYYWQGKYSNNKQ